LWHSLFIIRALIQFFSRQNTLYAAHDTPATVQLLEKTGLPSNYAYLAHDTVSLAGTTIFGALAKAAQAAAFPAFRLRCLVEDAILYNGWRLPEKGGAWINGRWYTEHALERMAPNTPAVMAKLNERCLKRAKAAGLQPQTEDFGKWWLDNKPNPRGIPPIVVEAEIIKPGSTGIRVILNQKGEVITVIPR
jgi:hypothetical protein